MPNDDADCDGASTALDCDDTNPLLGSVATDADCDGAVTSVDCDDDDPLVPAQDADCDGAWVGDDCDDTDPASGDVANDADCDGAVTGDDCDDADPLLGSMATDADCDGWEVGDDCDDSDPSLPLLDGDCDGFVPPEDCDDSRAAPCAPLALSLGSMHSCALLDTGQARCWGYSGSGQLGYGDTETVGDDEEPASLGDVDVGATLVAIAAGSYHTCGLSSTQGVHCWGEADFGQLGYGNTTEIGDDEPPATVGPVPVGLPAAFVAAGRRHTCVVTTLGTVRCWGQGSFGRLGYGDTDSVGTSDTPADAGDVDVGGTVVEVAAGYDHTCALLDDGSVRCWGLGAQGRLGYGSNDSIGDDEAPSVAGDVSVGGTAVQVEAGYTHTCALLDTGDVRCWGSNQSGQLGLGHTDAIGDDELPSSVGPVFLGDAAIDLGVGYQSSCALLASGDVRCWGRNDLGQLGLGSTEVIGDDEVPATVPVVPLPDPVVELASGLRHICAITSADEVLCWGSGGYGRLGYSDTENIGDDETLTNLEPVPIAYPLP